MIYFESLKTGMTKDHRKKTYAPVGAKKAKCRSASTGDFYTGVTLSTYTQSERALQLTHSTRGSAPRSVLQLHFNTFYYVF